MKKSIAFIGALFMGSIAFAQVSKNDNTNKTASRKVLDADVKDLPTDPDANVKTGEIKGNSFKHKGEDSDFMKVTDNNSREIKGSSTQKGNSNKSAADPYLKVSSANKANAQENNRFKVAGDQGQRSAADPYLKVTTEKKAPENTTIKVSGDQSQKSSSDPYLKVTSTKKE
ncbi:MAG: hypothetical protein JHC39_03930 [Lentimicrobium sp.]|jgi:hypothetical protein|nr:hypothetical protein [Lentimicrobium sp.]